MAEEPEPDERTLLAEDRTLLASERTFAGWVRTGLPAVGVGVGFHALFQTMEPNWIPKAIATIFLLLGSLVVVAAERRARAVHRRLSADMVVTARAMNLRLVMLSVAAGALALIVAIWLMPGRG
jgi:putative membrane protein